MTIGPGKYDNLCTYVRKKAGIQVGSLGGAIIIVLNGKHGSGFSAQTDAFTQTQIPDLLEHMAKEIREDQRRT